ncbi:MAG: nucleotide exchange factor GrpE [Thaumarchaeota archaeon]|nr:nucleotide exchange factor GrpE [Nitrososphaerota archaeon]MCL5317617.1 nucleotide exchange factor GrpE [Nitrososphaerota archaeon]
MSEEPEENPKRKTPDLRREVEELSRSLEAERKRADEYLTRLKYLQADFENYEKRVKREREDFVKMSSERIVAKMLPLLDELQIAVVESGKLKDAGAFVKGMEIILANLLDLLRQEGVEEIEALGRKFDPLKHEVVSFIETDSVEENTVVKELRRGYQLNGRVIRPSVVEVAKKPLKAGDQNPANNVEVTTV